MIPNFITSTKFNFLFYRIVSWSCLLQEAKATKKDIIDCFILKQDRRKVTSLERQAKTTNTHTHTHTLALSHTLTFIHTYIHTLSLSHTHTHILTHTNTISLSHTHTVQKIKVPPFFRLRHCCSIDNYL